MFEQVPFDHPLWVLYSSGTTGLPKAIVQSHGGILLEQLKKSHLHLDLHRGDRMFWFTTTGWMMWNFLVGCLFTEAAIVLYDGSPGHPDLGAMWALAERTKMTCMGVSAGLLSACEQAGVKPAREYDLSALRSIGSTGSPLAPESFAWVYREVKSDVWLFSTSGGTDVCTAFVGGCPLLPVYEGELQCRVLGCAVEAWDEQGHSVVDEVGELVLTEPLPSMPLYLWGDPDGERYRESYFSMYPGIWRHGDWIRITPRGGAVIYGRSDATINRQGVRMGTSEIYRAASAVEEVVDALVVDIPHGPQSGARPAELQMWLFVVLRPGVALDDDAEGKDQATNPRGLLAAARPRRGDADRRGATYALRQDAGGAGEADPDGRRADRSGERGLARQPAGARVLRGAGADAALSCRPDSGMRCADGGAWREREVGGAQTLR